MEQYPVSESPEPVEESHQRLLPADVLQRDPIDRGPFAERDQDFRSGQAGAATPADHETLYEYERGARSALWAASRTAEYLQWSDRLRQVDYEPYPWHVTPEVSRDRAAYTVKMGIMPIAVESSEDFQNGLLFDTDTANAEAQELFALARPLNKRSLNPNEARQDAPEIPENVRAALEKLGVGEPDESRFGIQVTSMTILVDKDVDVLLRSTDAVFSDREVAELVLAEGPGSLIATVAREWFTFDISPSENDGWWQQASIFVAEQVVHKVRQHHAWLREETASRRFAEERDKFWEEVEYAGAEDVPAPDSREEKPAPLLEITGEVATELIPEELGFDPWPDSDYKEAKSYAKGSRNAARYGRPPAQKPRDKK